MTTRIQTMADRVLSTLHRQGASSLTALCVELGAGSANDLALAVGWLAKQGRVHVERQARGGWWVSLAEQGVLTDLAHLDDLGVVIRQVLHRDGSLTMASLVRAIPGTTSSLIAMSVGWLAGDEMVTVSETSGGLMVGLSQNAPILTIRSKL